MRNAARTGNAPISTPPTLARLSRPTPGEFASLEREIKLSSYTIAVALLRMPRTQAERRPELLPVLGGERYGG